MSTTDTARDEEGGAEPAVDLEALYRQVLADEPDNLVANERLAYVLGLQGRAGEAAVYRLALLRHGKVLPLQLVLLALGETADENPETPALFHKAHPDDVVAQLAVARIAVQRLVLRLRQLLHCRHSGV